MVFYKTSSIRGTHIVFFPIDKVDVLGFVSLSHLRCRKRGKFQLGKEAYNLAQRPNVV